MDKADMARLTPLLSSKKVNMLFNYRNGSTVEAAGEHVNPPVISHLRGHGRSHLRGGRRGRQGLAFFRRGSYYSLSFTLPLCIYIYVCICIVYIFLSLALCLSRSLSLYYLCLSVSCSLSLGHSWF